MNSIEQFIASHPSGQQLMDEARLKRRATKKLLADYDKSLREQIAREQKEYLDHWQDFYLDTYPDDVIDCVGRDLIAIAKGQDPAIAGGTNDPR